MSTKSKKLPKGFRCPNCETELRVVITRKRATGIIARRRECPSCGQRVTTVERRATEVR